MERCGAELHGESPTPGTASRTPSKANSAMSATLLCSIKLSTRGQDQAPWPGKLLQHSYQKPARKHFQKTLCYKAVITMHSVRTTPRTGIGRQPQHHPAGEWDLNSDSGSLGSRQGKDGRRTAEVPPATSAQGPRDQGKDRL